MGSPRRIRSVGVGRSKGQRVRHDPAIQGARGPYAAGRLVQEAGVPEGDTTRGGNERAALPGRYAGIFLPAAGVVAVRIVPRDSRRRAQGTAQG